MWWGFFAKRVSSQKSLTIFAKKVPPWTFDWVLKMVLGNTVKKVFILKIFPKLRKTFLCVLILIMHILFCRYNKKNLLQKKIKDWVFEALLLTKESSSWFLLIGSMKMTYPRSYARHSWIFIKGRFGSFLAACLTQFQ